MGEPLRLAILERQRHEPHNVGELAEALGAETVTISHHLGVLRDAGLVVREKQRRFAVHHLQQARLDRTRGKRDEIDPACRSLEIPTE